MTDQTQQEQAAPVDWQTIARQRERELKQVGEARHRAEAAIARVHTLADRWKRNGTRDLARYADIMLDELDHPGPEETDPTPAEPDTRARYEQAVDRVESSGPPPGDTDQTGPHPWLLAGVRDLSIPQQPAEHCGHLSPQTLLTTPPTECVLRPGHYGSHADERGARWWPAPDNRARQILCGHFIIDSGHRRECTELLGHTGAHTAGHGPAWTVPEEPAPAATGAPDDLREQLAAALRTRLAKVHAPGASLEREDIVDYIGCTEYDLTDAVLAGTVQAAKQRYAAEQGGEAPVLEQLGYHAMGQALDLERVQAERDQLATLVTVVLGEFRNLPGTQTATASVEAETIDRWQAVLDQTEERP